MGESKRVVLGQEANNKLSSRRSSQALAVFLHHGFLRLQLNLSQTLWDEEYGDMKRYGATLWNEEYQGKDG